MVLCYFVKVDCSTAQFAFTLIKVSCLTFTWSFSLLTYFSADDVIMTQRPSEFQLTLQFISEFNSYRSYWNWPTFAWKIIAKIKWHYFWHSVHTYWIFGKHCLELTDWPMALCTAAWIWSSKSLGGPGLTRFLFDRLILACDHAK